MDTEQFMESNFVYITIVVFAFLILLYVFTVLGVNFNPAYNKQVQKVVTIEAFGEPLMPPMLPPQPTIVPKTISPESLKYSQARKKLAQENYRKATFRLEDKINRHLGGKRDDAVGFCKNAAPEDCTKLSDQGCTETDCCVFVTDNSEKSQCVKGDVSGPTFDRYSDNMDYYYYKNKCYGNCKQ